VYNRFRHWEAHGIWPQRWECRQAEDCHIFIDAMIGRAHQHAAGVLKQTAGKPHRL
jgi:transposase